MKYMTSGTNLSTHAPDKYKDLSRTFKNIEIKDLSKTEVPKIKIKNLPGYKDHMGTMGTTISALLLQPMDKV